MWKRLFFIFFSATLFCHEVFAGSNLTEIELFWLEQAQPVLKKIKQLQWPMDIVVQPDEHPKDSPIAMGFYNQRCQLVFSMRGNEKSSQILENLSDQLQPIAVEAIMIHEMAHCWRYLQGSWHKWPAGFTNPSQTTNEQTPELEPNLNLEDENLQMQWTRREEALADLVALAWTWQHHPQNYEALHTWFLKVRKTDLGGSHHDTNSWIELVQDPHVFDASSADVFERALVVWIQGLQNQSQHQEQRTDIQSTKK